MTTEKYNINLLLSPRELEVFYFALAYTRQRIRDRMASGWDIPTDLSYLAALTTIADAARPRNTHWKN